MRWSRLHDAIGAEGAPWRVPASGRCVR